MYPIRVKKELQKETSSIGLASKQALCSLIKITKNFKIG